MTEKEKQEYRKQETEAREAMEQAWEDGKESYIPSVLPDHREEEAFKLDTNNQISYERAHSQFEDTEPNWNDKIEDRDEMYRESDEILGKIYKVYGYVDEERKEHLKEIPDSVLYQLKKLLNCCFSERIKICIVGMVSDDETVEGACKHLFGVYKEDNRSFSNEIYQSMNIWYTLSNTIGEVYVYNAFLERSWHLNPTSQFFSTNRYGKIVEAVRSQRSDRQNRTRAKYADPYELLEALDQSYKKIVYTLRHTTDPAQIAKLMNSQVKLSGALWKINERLEGKHQDSVESAKRIARYTLLDTQNEQIIDVEEQKALPDGE